MPQTREHIAILDLLGIRGGVIALTKRDLVDDEWAELVSEDVGAAVAGTALAGAPVVHTSVVSGHGLEALRAALAAAASALPARDAADLFRMPVDRAFSVRGTGTVVTGTVWSGALPREASARLLPGGRAVRARGVESHGVQHPSAAPGTRAAIALAGVEVGDVHRGMTLVAGEGWSETRALLAEVAMLDGMDRALGPRTRVRFHLGTSDVGARIVCAGGALRAGERREARVVLDEPVVARAGDRFVIRSASPTVTIGGGIVGDPLPAARRPRPRARPAATPATRLRELLAEAAIHGVAVADIPVRTGARPADVPALVAGASDAVRVGDRLYTEGALRAVRDRVVAAVDEHHARSPLEAGAPLQMVRGRGAGDASLADEAIRRLVADGVVQVEGALIRRAGWRPRLTAAHERAISGLRTALVAAGREPPSTAELASVGGSDTGELLRLMEREGELVQVEAERYYPRQTVSEMLGALRASMERGREYAPPELRDILGFSRKFLIPFLEYCDRVGVTERRSAGRVIK